MTIYSLICLFDHGLVSGRGEDYPIKRTAMLVIPVPLRVFSLIRFTVGAFALPLRVLS